MKRLNNTRLELSKGVTFKKELQGDFYIQDTVELGVSVVCLFNL